MDLKALFKPFAQQIVDAALPRLRAEILALLRPALARALPDGQAQIALLAAQAALDGWAVKV